MWGLEDALIDLGANHGALALLLAVVVGLRHATDPDHLTAVAALVFGGDEGMARRAGKLGFAWGLGHAVTLSALGLPVVLLHARIPGLVHRIAEVAVGGLIIWLSIRLLVRWWRGTLHTHAHQHGPVWHAHPHVHEVPVEPETHTSTHPHPHAERLGRSPAAAFGIGLVHGVGGSAMVSVVLVAAFPSRSLAIAALLALAVGTALAMGLISALLGRLLGRGRGHRWLEAVVPVMGVASLAFGAWYAAVAAGV